MKVVRPDVLASLLSLWRYIWFSLLSMMLSVGILRMFFIKFRKFPPIPDLLRIVYSRAIQSEEPAGADFLGKSKLVIIQEQKK